MSRLFYHTMQDNAGNLLFDVSGTMRIAGTGTLATIYGDEALTTILPNPMSNHPSFGSFKCFLGSGDYDFYMAKSGYTFETLTGVQGHGTMAQQDASAVAITGGRAALTSQATGGVFLSDAGSTNTIGLVGRVSAGSGNYNLYCDGSGQNFLAGQTQLGGITSGVLPGALVIRYPRATLSGIQLQPTDSDSGGTSVYFVNLAGSGVGSITTSVSTTAYNTTSDARMKHAITPLTGALDVVRALNPVAFKWKADDSPGRGLLAGEVQEVIPDGVITGERGAIDDEGRILPQMIDYSKLVPYLIGAVKELTQQVEMLTAKLAAASV